MMRPANDIPAVYLCRDPVDFRRGINGLAVLVEDTLRLDPFAKQLYVFCNRRGNNIKVLYWEANGFCLWQKRLEKSRFYWPRKSSYGIVTLTAQQLNWLLDGYDISRLKPHEKLCFSSVL
jgi:transposase